MVGIGSYLQVLAGGSLLVTNPLASAHSLFGIESPYEEIALEARADAPINGTSASYTAHCGFPKPSKERWDAGVGERFQVWMDTTWDNFLTSNYTSFVRYMVGEFAPDAPDSQMVCDGLGTCSISNCKNLAEGLSIHDKEMAYYAFEQMANFDHISKLATEATSNAGEHIQKTIPDYLSTFSWGPRLQQEAKAKKEKKDLITHIVTTTVQLTVGMIFPYVSGMTAVVPKYMSLAEKARVASETASQAKKGIPTSSLFGKGYWKFIAGKPEKVGVDANGEDVFKAPIISPAFNKWYGKVNPWYNFINNQVNKFHSSHVLQGNFEAMFKRDFYRMTKEASDTVREEIYNLMKGNTMGGTLNMAFVLKSGEYVTPRDHHRSDINAELQKWYWAVALDSVWAYDRPYIIETNVERPELGCEGDERGPHLNRVCLPEIPDRVFWVYNLHRGQEYDGKTHRRQANIRTPAGLRRLTEPSQTFYNVTREDVVRSSIWRAAQTGKKPELAKGAADLDKVASGGGQVAGVFDIPICRNPGGEAISAVHEHFHGRIIRPYATNYPCMCGNFSWKRDGPHGPRTVANDETEAFFKAARLYGSEDLPKFCKRYNHCKEDEYSKFDFSGIKDGEEVSKTLIHPYRSCRSRGHLKRGKPYHGKPKHDTKRSISTQVDA